MVGPGGPGFPPMGPRYAGGPRGPPGMRMPIMGPGGEPFNGHPGIQTTVLTFPHNRGTHYEKTMET